MMVIRKWAGGDGREHRLDAEQADSRDEASDEIWAFSLCCWAVDATKFQRGVWSFWAATRATALVA
jgi:hypothetical protein